MTWKGSPGIDGWMQVQCWGGIAAVPGLAILVRCQENGRSVTL